MNTHPEARKPFCHLCRAQLPQAENMGGTCFSHWRLLPPWKAASFPIIQNILGAVETAEIKAPTLSAEGAPCTCLSVCVEPLAQSELAQQAQIRDLGSLRASGGFDKGSFPGQLPPETCWAIPAAILHPTQQGITFSWGCQTLWLSSY